MKKANFTTKTVSFTLIDTDSLPKDCNGYLADTANEINRMIVGEEIKRLRNKIMELDNALCWAERKLEYATENGFKDDIKEYKAWVKVYTIAIELCNTARALIG